MDVRWIVALLIGLVALTLMDTGCLRLPEYVVSVEADEGVTWYIQLGVTHNLGGGGQSAPGKRIESSEPSWKTTLEHKREGHPFARITAVAVVAFKTSGEGSVRVEITRNGDTVAQGEATEIGVGVTCEFAEGK